MAYAYDSIKLEKGMYQQSGMSFSEVLEKADPSENYAGTALEGLDAFQRQLKRFDIRVKGVNSDAVEKFYRTTQSAVLFPEYIARCVRQGMEEGAFLSDICAAVTSCEGLDYRSISISPDDGSGQTLEIVAEGTEIPATNIRTKDTLITLNKRGRMLVASYEAVRFQKLELFSVMLRQIGANIMRSHLEDAVDVLINGDGNNNAATSFSVGTDPISGTAGAIEYAQLIEFWAQFAPYEMNTMLVSNDAMVKLLGVAELQNPLTGLNFQGTGRLTSPLGAVLIRSSAVPEGTIIGMDKNYALELVRSGDVTVEYDKLIDRQLERAAVTDTCGFAKIQGAAVKVLKI